MKDFVISKDIEEICKIGHKVDVEQIASSKIVMMRCREYLGRGTSNIARAIYTIEAHTGYKQKSCSHAYGHIDEKHDGCTAIVTFEEPKNNCCKPTTPGTDRI